MTSNNKNKNPKYDCIAIKISVTYTVTFKLDVNKKRILILTKVIMNCWREYGDYEKCRRESTVMICHSFKDRRLFNIKENRPVKENEMEEAAKVFSEKLPISDSNENEKLSFQFVFGKYGTLKRKIKSQDNKERDLLKKQRSQQKKISKMKKELKVLKHAQEQQEFRLLDEIDATNKTFEQQTYELIGLHAEVEESDLVITAKDTVIDQIKSENEQYKKCVVTSSQHMIADLKVQLRMLGDELRNIERKLEQRWRIFGRAKLLKRFEKKGVLRMELERVVEHIDAQIDFMEDC